MRTGTTATAAVAAALLLALAGCGSSDAPKPAETVKTTVTAPAPLSKAEQTKQCVDAVAASANGEVPSEPKPSPCSSLTEGEYLDAYMDGIHQANGAALEQRRLDRDKAAENDQP